MTRRGDSLDLEAELRRLLQEAENEGVAPPNALAASLAKLLLDHGSQEAAPSTERADAAYAKALLLAQAAALLGTEADSTPRSPPGMDAAIHALLAGECQRLRQRLARTEAELESMHEGALVARAVSVSLEPADPDQAPWSARRQREHLDRIADLIAAFRGSLQWRIGHRTVALIERLLRRKSQPTALDAAEALARSELP